MSPPTPPPAGADPASTAHPLPEGSAASAARRGRIGALVEWAVWLAVAGTFYLQTLRFDEVIASYRLGPATWPRALALCVAVGATGQMLYRLSQAAHPAPETVMREREPWQVWAQRAGIFLLPLIWLWLIPRIGFYVSMPVFVLALMLLLEVRSIRALFSVTAVVCGLVLLIFTRFFYVGLPTGTLDGFYEANNWIIATARWGV